MSPVKVLETAVKAAVVADQRTIDFYAAAFSDVPDTQGERIDPHAFDAWLGEFYQGGRSLPISFAHAALRLDTDPENVIGYAPPMPEHVYVDDYGLRVKGYLYTGSNPKADLVFRQIQDGVVRAASVGLVFDPADRSVGRDGVATLRKAGVKDVGPCLYGANIDAYVVGVKSDTEVITEVEATSDGITETTTVEETPVDSEQEQSETMGKALFKSEEVVLWLKHGAAPSHIQSAHDALVSAGAKCASGETSEKTEQGPPKEPEAAEPILADELEQVRVRLLRLATR